MSTRCVSAFLAASALAAVAVALSLGTAGSASASVSWPAAQRATPECLVLPNCVSLYQFGPVNSPQLVLEATGVFPNAPVIVNADDPTDSDQDWTYIDLGTVGIYQTAAFRNRFGLNGFDFANYGADEMYQLEFSPAGIPSGLCAANVANRMVLRTCNGSRFQTMISADKVRRMRTAPLSYYYGLSVAQHAAVPAHHLSVTGSRFQGAQVIFTRPVISDNQFWQPS